MNNYIYPFLVFISLLQAVPSKGSELKRFPKPPSQCQLSIEKDLYEPIEKAFNRWDFSSLDENDAAATISLMLDPQGKLHIMNIMSDNASFIELIEKNLPKTTLETCPCSNQYFRISLKYDFIDI